jgi:hypothetical protein
MVRFQRSLQAVVGKFPQAVSFAIEITEYVNKRYQTDLKVFTDSKGCIFWITDYPDYATFGEVRSQITKDQGYWEIVAKAEGVFIDESLHDTVMTPIG